MGEQHRHDIAISRRSLLGCGGAVGALCLAGCTENGGEISFPLSVRMEYTTDNADAAEWTQAIAQVMNETGYFDVTTEDYVWDEYIQRVFSQSYPENGYIPFIRLSGTFDPSSFAETLHGTANQGQCCNLNGLGTAEIDAMMDRARFGAAVAEDPVLRKERYDDIWYELDEYRGTSVIHFVTDEYVRRTKVHGFSPYPLPEETLQYALHEPADTQVMWIDTAELSPSETDHTDLNDGGTLRYGVTTNIPSFDPPYSTDTISELAQSLIFEQLVTIDRTGTVYPWLAKRYERLETNDISRDAYEAYMESVPADPQGALEFDGDEPVQDVLIHPDDDRFDDDEVRVLTPAGAAEAVDEGVFGMQWRYILHEGVEFTNGEELTAETVVRSVERYENSEMAAQTFDSMLHARAVDEYTVDLYAQIPDAEAERELPGIAILSTEQAGLAPGEIDPRESDTEPIGTGPYVFEEFEDERYFIAVKNDSYWLEERGLDALEWWDGPDTFPAGPVISKIDISIIPDDSTRSSALQNDEIDLTDSLPADTVSEFDVSSSYIVDSIQSGGLQFFQYPVTVEPWDDPRLRKAVNHLIPREEIVDEVLDGWGEPAWTWLPELARGPGTADYDQLEADLRSNNEFDPEQAIELIETVIADRGYDSSV